MRSVIWLLAALQFAPGAGADPSEPGGSKLEGGGGRPDGGGRQGGLLNV